MKAAAATCPEETELSGFIARTLAAGDAAKLEAHIADCDDCRRLLFALASSRIGEPSDAEAVVERIGKFEVLDVIGRGAMGVVYRARDPELDRVVAIKVRQGTSKLDVDGEDRVRREAQALARLTHPNVVAIYEAGRHEQSTFLAMEYVEGAPLDEWLAEQRRLREDIIARMVEAGQGLAAAHAVGLVHRDFKPRNVFVAKAGSAKVGDFGLVRVEGDAASDGASTAELPRLALTLTLTGAMLGTPAYMSPEQLRGDTATEASDQFSYCVTLYEALYGQRPFEGTTIEKLLGAMTRPFSLPATPRVARNVARVLQRGLSIDPSKRFPSMRALLEVLDARTVRRRRGLLVGATAAIALAAGGVAVAAMNRTDDRAAVCRGGERKLTGVWDVVRKQQIRAAFTATGMPYANDAWLSVERILDGYTGSWLTEQRAACEATRVHGDQTAQMMDLRMWCLDDRLREAQAVTDLLAGGGKRVVKNAVDAVSRLPSVESCADVRTLSEKQPPRDAAAKQRIEALHAQLSKEKMSAQFVNLPEGVKTLTKIAEAAKAEDYAPLEAEVLVELARLRFMLDGDAKQAEQMMTEALLAAERGRHDVVRARSWIVLIFIVGIVQARFPEGHKLAEHARAVIKRLVGHAGLEGQVLGNEGQVYMVEGKLAEAEAQLKQALVILEKASGKDHVETGQIVSQLSDIARRKGEHQLSLDMSLRAYEIHKQAYGAGHPEAAKSRFGVGMALEDMGRFDEALVEVQGVIATLEAALGPEHIDLAPAADELGIIYRKTGKLKEAEALHRRSLALREKSLGPDHPDTTLSLDNLAMALAKQRRFDEALPLQARSLAALETSLGPDHPEVPAARNTLANIYLEAKRFKDAYANFERAVKDGERILGRDHHDLTFYLSGMGQALMGLKKPREAAAAFERSLALRGSEANPNDTAAVRFDLAKALWDAKLDRKRAVELAESARAAYKSLDMPDVEDWLKSHKL